MRKIVSLSITDVQILPISSNGRKEIMEALKEILIKNEWFTKQEVEEIFTSDVMKCIDECTRPKQDEIFNAFNNLKPKDVRVLIIGQDPYPDTKGLEIADGMAFSSKNVNICPNSLKKIFDEIIREYKKCDFKTNSLVDWKNQGVLLLNSSLTFCPSIPINISTKVWKTFINKVIDKILLNSPLVVMLWGRKAQKAFGKRTLNCKNILVLQSSHPNPRNKKYDTFSGNKHFKKCNEFLKMNHVNVIEWWKLED